MHRYEILPVIWLTDIKIHIQYTDNRSDVYIYRNSTSNGQIVTIKFLLVYENNVIRVCKINFPINWLISQQLPILQKCGRFPIINQ